MIEEKNGWKYWKGRKNWKDKNIKKRMFESPRKKEELEGKTEETCRRTIRQNRRIVGSTGKEEENWKNENIKKKTFQKPEKEEELEGTI